MTQATAMQPAGGPPLSSVPAPHDTTRREAQSPAPVAFEAVLVVAPALTYAAPPQPVLNDTGGGKNDMRSERIARMRQSDADARRGDHHRIDVDRLREQSRQATHAGERMATDPADDAIGTRQVRPSQPQGRPPQFRPASPLPRNREASPPPSRTNPRGATPDARGPRSVETAGVDRPPHAPGGQGIAPPQTSGASPQSPAALPPAKPGGDAPQVRAIQPSGQRAAKPSGDPQPPTSVTRGKDEQSQSARETKQARPTGEPRDNAATRQAVLDRIAKMVNIKALGNDTVARIQLDPPSLGVVRVHLRLNGQRLQLRLAAESDQTRELLKSHAEELRLNLERRGLLVQRIELVEPVDTDAQHGKTTSDSESHHSNPDASLMSRRDTPVPDGRHRSPEVREDQDETGAPFEPTGWAGWHMAADSLDVRV